MIPYAWEVPCEGKYKFTYRYTSSMVYSCRVKARYVDELWLNAVVDGEETGIVECVWCLTNLNVVLY